MNNPLLSCQQIGKSYSDGENQVDVLHDLSMQVNAGEHLAIVGSSGSGKSTLLHILGALDKPTTGDILFEGNSLLKSSERQLAQFRNEYLGFVYQFHHLLGEFSALENVAMPLMIAQKTVSEANQTALDMLDKVGLSHRAKHKPSELSGGERQRVAIARALVNQPKLVLADEPTGNLDQDNAWAIFDLIETLKNELATSFVIVTHDLDLASRMDRQLKLVKGRLQGEHNE